MSRVIKPRPRWLMPVTTRMLTKAAGALATIALSTACATPATAPTAAPATALETTSETAPDMAPTALAAGSDVIATPDPGTRNGGDIYQAFREGLADPNCEADVSDRWSRHYAAAPKRLARRDDTLALFGYVVDAVREAGLPSEYALIPFVESGYKPGARSPLGAAGMWQMITRTARDHDVTIRKGFDGRLSPVQSTRAAVDYLRTLHGLFAGDWRLAVMAYNAGQFRILDALERGGQLARDAQPQKLPGLPRITKAYVRKLQALSCLLQQADKREEWHAAIDRPAPRLEAVTLPADVNRIDAWAERTDRDSERVRRLNPAYAGGRVPRAGDTAMRVLAAARPQVGAVETDPAAEIATAAAIAPDSDAAPP